MNDGTWITLAVVALSLAAVAALAVYQMRTTLVDVAAQRLGHVAGGFAGLGIVVICIGALGERIGDAPIWVVVLSLVAGLLLAMMVANMAADYAMRIVRAAQPGVRLTTPPMILQPGQRVVWSETLRSKWLLLPAAAVLLLGPLVMFAPDAPVWLLGVVVVAGLAILSLASIRVTADSHGLRVKYGILPWPHTVISIDRIASASAIDVRPVEWGGWGYRGTLTLMRQAAVVLRAGPGIRVDLHDGKVFVVTVDDPETPSALLNAEVARLGV